MKPHQQQTLDRESWKTHAHIHKKIQKRIVLTHRISVGVLILLLIIPFSLSIQYAIAISIIQINLALHLCCLYKSEKWHHIPKNSFQKSVQDEVNFPD